MPTYFHGAGALLAPGSIIEPGNWGRIIRLYTGAAASWPNAYKEHVLEQARKEVAPMKPSRLEAVFACPSLEGLRHFLGSTGRHDAAYEVEPVQDAPTHEADYNIWTIPPGVAFFDTFPFLARGYWTAAPPPQSTEVLIGGPVRVLRRIAN